MRRFWKEMEKWVFVLKCLREKKTCCCVTMRLDLSQSLRDWTGKKTHKPSFILFYTIHKNFLNFAKVATPEKGCLLRKRPWSWSKMEDFIFFFQTQTCLQFQRETSVTHLCSGRADERPVRKRQSNAFCVGPAAVVWASCCFHGGIRKDKTQTIRP